MNTLETDVCVVGGGLAGLAAANRAAEQGLKVLVLEQSNDPDYLCNTRLAGGVFHVCVRDLQSDAAVLERAILDGAGGEAHPELARAIATEARRAVKWLQSKGVRFIRGGADPHHNLVLAPPALQRLGLDWRGRGGDVLLRTLLAGLGNAGGRFLAGHRANELLVQGGRCEGLSGTSSAGPFLVRARAVVIADGGFQGDPELLRANITPEPGSVLQRNSGASRGDGLKMALAAGARASSLCGFYGHLQHRDALSNAMLWPYPWLDDLAAAGLLVKEDGQRFVDEGRGGVFCANAVAGLTNPLGVHVVFDQTVWELAGKARFLPANPHLEKAGGTVLRADSIESLASLMQVPAGNLARTVDQFNATLQSQQLDGLTPPRSVPAAGLTSMTKAPFRAIPVVAGVTNTMGGIAIDQWARAMHTDGRPFDGLYAVGGASGGLEGGASVGYVGGLAKAATTGLLAAEHIADNLRAPEHK